MVMQTHFREFVPPAVILLHVVLQIFLHKQALWIHSNVNRNIDIDVEVVRPVHCHSTNTSTMLRAVTF